MKAKVRNPFVYAVILLTFAIANMAEAQFTLNVDVDAGQTLTQADLTNGSFDGETFLLFPPTTFDINSGGTIGPVNNGFTPFSSTSPVPFDFGGSTVNINNGGHFESEHPNLGNIGLVSPSAVSNLTLNVLDGGSVGADFEATSGTVNILGGNVGTNFKANFGSTINLFSGNIGTFFDANLGSTVNISGGNFNSIDANSGSTINVTGGQSINGIDANSGSDVDISGGSFRLFDAFSGSIANISGGRFGGFFDALPGSTVQIYGGEFMLNGASYTGSFVTISKFLEITDVLTGTFEDGSPFIFSPQDSRLASGFGDRLSNVRLTNRALPALDLTPIVVDGTSGPAPSGIRAGQTLTLEDGGELGDFFAVVDATLSIDGGTIGEGLETAGGLVNISGGIVGHSLKAYAGSTLNIQDGIVDSGLEANSGSIVNISGGTIGSDVLDFRDFNANSGSIVNISGGSIDDSIFVNTGSRVNISGGNHESTVQVETGGILNISGGFIGGGFGGEIFAESGSLVKISGGIIGDFSDDFDAQSGSTVKISGGNFAGKMDANPGSTINLVVSDLFLDGVPVNLIPQTPTEIATGTGQLLSGTFSDGSFFDFLLNANNFNGVDYFATDATLIVTLVPEPSALALMILTTVLFLSASHRRQLLFNI